MWYCKSIPSTVNLQKNKSLFRISLNKHKRIMRAYKTFKHLILPALFAISLTACDSDEDQIMPEILMSTPATYEFSRNGASSVSYSGQTERLNQIAEMKNEFKKGDNGDALTASTLLDMFSNVNDNGNGNFSFTSSKQLENKTFTPDVQFYKDLFAEVELASANGANNVTATNGTSGLLLRSSGKTILVSDSGFEFTQTFEKGMMGSLIMYQISNVYTTSDKIGNSVDNTNLVEGKNYTTMEHHMDEAFGYYGAPVNFSSSYSGTESPKFWASYSEELNANTGSIDVIMHSYKTARQAIVVKKYDNLNSNIKLLNESLERLAAAAAVHYVNAALNATTDGDRMHVLSELVGFTKALKFGHPSYRKLALTEVNQLIETNIGKNLWNVTTAGLNNLKTEISGRYNLNAVKDIL
jgi:hypothetical protein